MTKEKLRKTFNILYEIISTALMTAAVLLAVLYLCGIRLYHVKSGSMGELLPVGCVCFVNTHADFADLQAGDIIAFRVSDEMLVTHRAIAVTAEGIRTQGDENETPDPDPVTAENYIGKTVFALPRIGAVLGFLQTFTGKILLGTAILLLLGAGFFYKRQTD